METLTRHHLSQYLVHTYQPPAARPPDTQPGTRNFLLFRGRYPTYIRALHTFPLYFASAIMLLLRAREIKQKATAYASHAYSAAAPDSYSPPRAHPIPALTCECLSDNLPETHAMT